MMSTPCVLVNWSRGVKKSRAELAASEGVEGAEAGGEFGGGQAALAVEATEKIVGGLLSFLGVTFHATGDQVAVGIAPRAYQRHDVVQAPDRRRGATQAVEAFGRARGRGWPFAASRSGESPPPRG